MWMNIVLRWLLIILATWIVVRQTLKTFFGISIGYINPLRLRIINFSYKDIISVGLIEINPFRKRIRVANISIKNAANKTTIIKETDSEILCTLDSEGRTNGIKVPNWLSTYIPSLLSLLNELHLVIDHVYLLDFNVSISTVGFVFNYDTESSKFKFDVFLRKVKNNDDIILSDSFQQLELKLVQNIQNGIIEFNNIKFDSKFGVISLPNAFLKKLPSKATNVVVEPEVPKHKDILCDLAIKDTITYFRRQLDTISSKILPIDEINLYLDKFLLNDIEITNLTELAEISQFFTYNICASNVTLNIVKFSKDYPGFKLNFDELDTPYKINSNFSRVNVGVKINRKDTDDIFLAKVVEIPSVNIYGHTNLFSQHFHFVENQLENALSTLNFQISSIIVDLDISTLSFIKSFLTNVKVFKGAFEQPDNDAVSNNIHRQRYKKILRTYLTSLFPLLNLKFSLEDSKLILNDDNDTIIMHMALLLVNYKSERNLSKPLNEKLESHITYKTTLDLEASSITSKHIIMNELDYQHKILNIDSVTLRQNVEWSPNIQFSLDGSIDNVLVDLSELPTMLALNKLLKNQDCQILKVEERYFKELYDRFAKQLKTVENSCTRIKKAMNIEKISPQDIFFQCLPEYFDYIKLDLRKLKITLGARSVFMPPNIFTSLESQSPKDLVDGKLRKFCNTIDLIQLALFSNKTQWHNRKDSGQTYMSKSGDSSIRRDDDSTYLDDISTSQSTEIERLWNFNILLNNITTTVMYETCKFSTEFSSRKVAKIKVISLKIFPETESYTISGEKRITVLLDNKLISSVTGLMNVFMAISGFHTLKQIFTKDTCAFKNESCAKKFIVALNNSKKKSIFHYIDWKKLPQLIHLNISSEFIHQILALPNGLKIKFEFGNVFMNVDKLNDISITGDFVRMCVESSLEKGFWVRMMLINKFKIVANIADVLNQIKTEAINDLQNINSITLSNESWHFTIPHQFAMYKIFDNISTVVKSLKQMLFSMKTSKSDLVIFPSIMKPVKLPNINLQSKRFVCSLQDDPLESELNMIFQIGLEEQRLRIEKIKQFQNSVLKRPDANVTSEGSSNTKNEHAFVEDMYTRLTFLSCSKNCKKSQAVLKKLLKKSKTVNKEDDNENIPLTETNTISVEDERAFFKLQENISTSWIRRIKDFRNLEEENHEENFEYLWGSISEDNLSNDFNTRVQPCSHSPFLSTIIAEGININITKPTFGIKNIPDFIHEVGKGVPLDTEYSIMFPMFLDANFREFRWHLRDYPLPFINIPAPLESQKTIDNFKISGDLCVTEAMITSDREIRTLFVPLVPSVELLNKDKFYSLLVPRTITSIKFYSNLELKINTEQTTQVSWGSCLSPAIQQTMQCLENISKPPLDRSPKPGFWDKIRYSFHSRVKILWKKESRFEISLLGGKSPYKIGGKEAGFIIGFHGNTILTCNPKDHPKQFLSCSADEIYFAIPNYFAKPLLVWSMPSSNGIFIPNQENSNLQAFASYYYLLQQSTSCDRSTAIKTMQKYYIEKTGIKLSGGMTLELGFVFEGQGKDDSRFTKFIPHYKKYLCNPIYVEDFSTYDAYEGFRSSYIHMSFRLLSNSSNAYNALQLDSAGLSTFMSWWSSFSNNPPVRMGSLYEAQNLSPKFGNALRTISYRADVSPLYISHIQRDMDISNSQKTGFYETVEFAGIKAKVSRFLMDLHQRKEVVSEFREKLNEHKKVSRMKFLDGNFSSGNIDIRTVHATFHKATFTEEKANGKFNLYRDDFEWLDLSDFKEPFSIAIDGYVPNITISPLLLAPDFLYHKRSKYGDKYQINPITSKKIEPFRNDISHECCVSGNFNLSTEPLDERIKLLKDKIVAMNEKLESIKNDDDIRSLKSQLELTMSAVKKIQLLREDCVTMNTLQMGTDGEHLNYPFVDKEIEKNRERFENRYFIFGMFLKWNEASRDTILKYLSYFKLNKHFSSISDYKSIRVFEDIIKQHDTQSKFLNIKEESLKQKVSADNSTQTTESEQTKSESDILDQFEKGLSELITSIGYNTSEDHYVQMVCPQVQLSSKFEPNACIVLTAPTIKLRVVSFESATNDDLFIKDKFLKRYGVFTSKANVFLFHKDRFKDSMDIYFGGMTYGLENSGNWLPWLGPELCFDSSSIDDFAIIKDLNAIIYIDSVSEFSTVYDLVRHELQDGMNVTVPKVQITCDSKSYLSLFKISSNLFMSMQLSNPNLKKQIDRVSIAFDFTELYKIYDVATLLSEVLHKAKFAEKELIFRQHLLDDAENVDLFNIHNERISNLSKLYVLLFVLCAKCKESHTYSKSMEWNIKIDKIDLLMLNEDSSPFLNVVSKTIKFKRKAASTGYNSNSLTVDITEVFDLEKSAIYKNILGPYIPEKTIKNGTVLTNTEPLFNIKWVMDKPVGGIKVVKNVETHVTGISLGIEEDTVIKVLHWALPNEVASVLHSDDNSDDISSKDTDNGDTESIDSEFYFEGEENTELNEMIQRSTDFAIMENIVINGFKLCISFKGKGTKRLINVTDFVFNFPKLSFVNETMRSIDIILVLKKVLLKSLIKQSGKFLISKLKRNPSLESRKLLLSPPSLLMNSTSDTESNDTRKEVLHVPKIQIPSK